MDAASVVFISFFVLLFAVWWIVHRARKRKAKEVKARQEAEAKAWQEAEAKTWQEAEAEAKAEQEAEAEAKAEQEAKAKAWHEAEAKGRRAAEQEPETKPRIFISYRREHSIALAGRISDWLVPEFGDDHIFIDVDKIRAGSKFVKVINDEVAKCDVLIALIGHDWLSDAAGHRLLDNPNDFVRLEIAAALQRQIRVIPILVDGTPIPRADQLPDDLQELAQYNALDLRNVSFRADMDRLLRELKR
jgi:hypothetical protein